VSDVATWNDGMAVPARVPDTADIVSSDVLGNIPATAIWSDPQTIGEYDIVVDVNGNGLYDVNVDVLDDNDTMVTAGFIIPEFSAVMLLLMLITLSGIITYKKRLSL